MMWDFRDEPATDGRRHHRAPSRFTRHAYSNPDPTFPSYDAYPMPSPSPGFIPHDSYGPLRAMPTPDTLTVPMIEHRGRRHSHSHVHVHHHSSHGHRRHSHSQTRVQTQNTNVQTIAPGVVVITHPPSRPPPRPYHSSLSHTPQWPTHLAPPPAIHPQFRYSRCCGRKKALCIGINYKGTRHELYGCINDANAVRQFLIKYEGFKARDIVLLTDDNPNPRSRPTRQNMLDAMRWLVKDAQPDDSLFFHYSGHGGQTKDLDGDEVDGFDEVIFPLDYEKAGHIVDDRMHSVMVKPLPAGCRLTAIFDSCHSGTVLDLPYIYSSSGRLKGSHVSNRARKRKATPADVISWSGCEDKQTSADTFSGGVAVGAMSHAFISSMKANQNQTYQELLTSVRRILHPKYSQKPQLGSSHPIDTNLRFII
ncbi:caspase domain-containing protein [Schizophyllum amplum]|uniref:Caspase domain-containing protein n=1 Tax=Schizophyllum amplum TaxID=97359 RepID=A0A550C1H3_9AGAR|nr:caspase domain-containing protein [Auriculariopsis ampla]